jgi:hypothetical protein
MLTRLPRIVEESKVQASEPMIIIRTTSMSIPISAEHQLSSSFFDFLERCMDNASSLEDIATVSSPI